MKIANMILVSLVDSRVFIIFISHCTAHTRHTHNSNDSDASMDEQGDTINRLRNKQDYYDPDQDKNLKRSIRKGYRSLIDKAEEQSVDVSNVTAKQLTAEMMKANSLYDNVRAPQEATLDSRFLIVQSEMSAAKARAMKIDADSFDLDEFLNRFKSVAGGFNIDDHLDQDVNEEDEHNVTIDWGIISNVALKHTRRIPVSDFMYVQCLCSVSVIFNTHQGSALSQKRRKRRQKGLHSVLIRITKRRRHQLRLVGVF